MLYWIDKTDFLQMQKKYNEEKKCNNANTSRWI